MYMGMCVRIRVYGCMGMCVYVCLGIWVCIVCMGMCACVNISLTHGTEKCTTKHNINNETETAKGKLNILAACPSSVLHVLRP